MTVAELQAENERLRKHVSKLQLACMVVLEEWWPLVYERTCRDTVRAQGRMVREAIAGGPEPDPFG
ncbi:hypothetical protein ACQUJS_03040 [Ralstonia pseudosolanacearum]|uniref:Uncharacterized protein n=1 Tax=Ralstonia solanacearum TaxID=305 RepID=A0A0S4TX95_RALSL|nr:protein of unknown function [Ralstonia solanacearum]